MYQDFRIVAVDRGLVKKGFLFKHFFNQFGGNQFGPEQSSYRKRESAPGWELLHNLCLIVYKPNVGRDQKHSIGERSYCLSQRKGSKNSKASRNKNLFMIVISYVLFFFYIFSY